MDVCFCNEDEALELVGGSAAQRGADGTAEAGLQYLSQHVNRLAVVTLGEKVGSGEGDRMGGALLEPRFSKDRDRPWTGVQGAWWNLSLRLVPCPHSRLAALQGCLIKERGASELIGMPACSGVKVRPGVPCRQACSRVPKCSRGAWACRLAAGRSLLYPGPCHGCAAPAPPAFHLQTFVLAAPCQRGREYRGPDVCMLPNACVALLPARRLWTPPVQATSLQQASSTPSFRWAIQVPPSIRLIMVPSIA